ncbi:CoA transferase [Caldimonas sp. KR1-144]|uniref:CoA transferase n=1 Tax=Caldimonas sp. KR1-144 TaxID=3400911 RepID=UPI003BFC8D36
MNAPPMRTEPVAPPHAMKAFDALTALWLGAGGEPGALQAVTLSGDAPVLPSSFAVDVAAQASIAAATLAARELGRERGGPAQTVQVDRRHAAVAFRSERYLRVDGQPAPELWDRIAGLYRCEGGWVRVHTNFPHHRDGVLRLLGCAHERDAVAAALARWRAEDFEQAAAEAGLVANALRSFAQWDAHAQGLAVAREPLLAFERLDDAAPRALPPLALGASPLAGLRVLDLTRIIAGPVAGRTLAAHGAEVLLVTAAHLPSVAPLVIDTGRGKRSTQLDLRTREGADALRALVREADVVIRSYRPGALDALGFSARAMAQLRPGLVVATLSAWGAQGPWAQRRGFDSLVQAASGFNLAEAEAAGDAQPRALPAQALDHASGYLLALGALQALRRRAHEGGSWHVRVSLARTGLWLRSLGRVEQGFAVRDPGFDDVRDLLEESDSGFGRLAAVRHAGGLAATPARWVRPSVPLGTDASRWLSGPPPT